MASSESIACIDVTLVDGEPHTTIVAGDTADTAVAAAVTADTPVAVPDVVADETKASPAASATGETAPNIADAVAAAAALAGDSENPTIQLLNGPKDLKSALLDTGDVVQSAHHLAVGDALFTQVLRQKRSINRLVAHHLNLDYAHGLVRTSPPRFWLRGSFNVCVPVECTHQGAPARRYIIRFAMPFKLSETHYPGSVDEKMSAEIGTYVWMQEKCPDVRIPRLYGFGFLDQRLYTHISHRPLLIRLWHYTRRLARAVFGRPAPDNILSYYTSHPAPEAVLPKGGLLTAYMLLEDVRVGDSQALSLSYFTDKREDPTRRQRLFRGLAQILVSLARVPLPRIGSFRFHADGTVSLANRPLRLCMTIYENQGQPRTIEPYQMYCCTDAYAADLLAIHDQRLRSFRNAVFDERSCYTEMAAHVLLRSLANRYIDRARRQGPFVLQLDDLHPGNFFVDSDWNVTCLVDLEWVCALPAENLHVPYWLSGRAVHQLETPELVAEFDAIRREFVQAIATVEEEEKGRKQQPGLALAQTIQRSWESGAVWAWAALGAVDGVSNLLNTHLVPRYVPLGFMLPTQNKDIANFWTEGAAGVVETKLAEYHAYQEDVRRLFAGVKPPST